MPDIYLQPGSGSGSGTLADPYYYSELSTAQSNAGNGGRILFTDGTYPTAASTWGTGGFSDLTYRSLNLHGAKIATTTVNTLRFITLDDSSTVTCQVENFELDSIAFRGVNSSSTFTFTISGVKRIDTGTTATSVGIVALAYGVNHKILNSLFYLKPTGAGTKLTEYFSQSGKEINGCTFYLDVTNMGTGASGLNGSGFTGKNNIIMSTDSTRVQDAVINSANLTNCCIYQMHTNDSSGGTNNIFTDPLFVDASTLDFRLRPTSPCINAGTAS